MRRAVTITSVVVVATMASVAALSVWLGSIVTERLALVAEALGALSPNIELTDQQLERGLFSSTRTLTMRLGCLPAALIEPLTGAPAPPTTPIQLGVRHVVQHGPFPGGAAFGVAAIDSYLLLPPAWQARVAAATGKQPLLHLHTTLGFGGDYVTDFTLAGLRYSVPEQGSVVSEAVEGNLRGELPERSGMETKHVLHVPGIAVTMRGRDASSVLLKVGSIRSEIALGARPDPTLWLAPATSRAVISSLELTGSVGGDGSSSLPAVRAHADNLSLSSEGTIENGLWSSSSNVTGKGRINDLEIDKVELAASVKRLHALTSQRLMAQLFDSMLSCERPAGRETLEALPTMLQEGLSTLLVHDPEYGLDKLVVEIGGKRAELAYSVGTEGVTQQDLAIPAQLLMMEKGFVRGSARVDIALVERVAQHIANEGVASPSPAAAQVTVALVRGAIDKFAGLGFLELEGETVKASAALEGGRLLLNGRPFALPGLALPLGP